MYFFIFHHQETKTLPHVHDVKDLKWLNVNWNNLIDRCLLGFFPVNLYCYVYAVSFEIIIPDNT